MQKNIRKCLTLRESFAEVRREESRKRVMMNPSSQDTPSLEARGSALEANKQDDGHVSQSRDKVWCDYCKKPYHTRETCWDLHGKPPDWKPRKQCKQSNQPIWWNQIRAKVTGFNFSTEQVEILRQLLNQTKVSTGSESQNSKIPTAAMAQT
ncbi:hypothetical protein CISIN_1g045100mg, partial [Citrus sinensis]